MKLDTKMPAETITNLIDKYQEFLTLSYVTSRKDPEEEPFISKYLARALLQKELDNLDNELPNESGQDKSEFMESLEVKHLVATYEHFMAQIDTTVRRNFADKKQSGKSYMIAKLLEFNLAKNYVETDEVEAGERIFAKIVQELDALSGHDVSMYNPVLFNLKMSCFLELVFVWSNRANYTKCHSLLASVEQMYEMYRVESKKNHLVDRNEFTAVEQGNQLISMPFDPSETLQLSSELMNSDRQQSVESLYTYSLFFSAQIYGKLDKKVQSAEYCRLTLQRQIDEHSEKVGSAGKDEKEEQKRRAKSERTFKQQPVEKISFDPLEWATHAGALSQYYVCEEDFPTARHCLVCADAILVKLNRDKPVVATDASPDAINPNEKLEEQTASIRRCWGKYGIALLKFAIKKLRESTDEPDTLTIHKQLDKPSSFHFNLPIDLYDTKAVELTALTSNIPLDYEQARAVFLKSQAVLNEVAKFFVLDGYVSDHSEIMRDQSELYSCLIFFDPDLDRRCKMQKRRLDLLIPICDSISEQYYMQLKRQYLFDVGSIYSDLLDFKLEILVEKQEKLKASGNPLTEKDQKEIAASIVKVNQLANHAVKRFDDFLTTMKLLPEKKSLPDKFDDHNVRPALLAKFYLGRLYSKIVNNDSKVRLEYCRLTLECYSYLVKYCDDHREDTDKEVIDSMKLEYHVCKEMCTFLPGKMDKIRALLNK